MQLFKKNFVLEEYEWYSIELNKPPKKSKLLHWAFLWVAKKCNANKMLVYFPANILLFH